MAFVVNSVLAYGVDLVLIKEFASFALRKLKIHSLMNQLRILTMILHTLSTYHHSPRHTLVSYVEIIITTQAANLSTHTSEPSRRFNSICYDDDDEERTIPLRDIISQLSPSIVTTTSPPILPIEDPKDYLIIGNEDLNTIPKKESDEFINSSVDDLVPIPIEYEDTSGSESEYVLPSCDDFSPINVTEEKFVLFSNPIFYDDFTSSDDESLSDEDVPEENVKIYSNTLFEFDD
uniref:Uncharacterized protein n=1 Tax=Tanacetum cinerariifolium TaxID=118510 RepID=A0A6L2JEG2_TANCI|nr:hypothetical protein [Tanacetum cinerariifolium]